MREIWASVTERGQVTIPAEVRKALGIQKREKVVFAIEDGVVVLKKPRFTLETVSGSVPALKEKLSWEEITRRAHEEVAERVVQKTREE
jgi:AbrB family looped-hinge helix DNA binding protein